MRTGNHLHPYRKSPLAEELDREERFPVEIYDQMAVLGLFGICVPEAMGGRVLIRWHMRL